MAPRLDPCVWRSWVTEEQKWVGWEMWVRVKKIIPTVTRDSKRTNGIEFRALLAGGDSEIELVKA